MKTEKTERIISSQASYTKRDGDFFQQYYGRMSFEILLKKFLKNFIKLLEFSLEYGII